VTQLAAPGWREVLRGRQGRLLVGLVGLETVGAIEQLVAVTAMPAAARALGHLALYGWVFAVPGLAAVAVIPVAARDLDRAGPRRALLLMALFLGGGTLVAGAAPDMLVLLAGRLLQGVGTGLQYAVGLGLVVRDVRPAHRARAFALLAGAWVLPGMVGPMLGGVLAGTLGWRWAFWAFLPLVGVGLALVWPVAGRAAPAAPPAASAPLRWSLQVAGAGVLCLVAVTQLTAATVPLLASGLALGLPAVARLSAGGQTAAPRSLRLALALVALITLAFFAVNSFLPLLLTRVRHEGLILASLAITASTLGWSLGNWWQSQQVARWSARRLIALGTAALGIGILGVAATLAGAPAVLADVAWTVAGAGIGIAYPTVYLVATQAAVAATAAATAGLVMVMDTLGASAGSGLAGSAVALARQGGHGVAVGLAGAIGLALIAAAAALALVWWAVPGPAG